MVQVSTMRNSQRRNRTPQHRFQLRHKPWQIQPMLIAPVLPGETMQNLLIQSRVVTDPLANRLIGWWQEYYFFYVKLRDLAYGQQSRTLDEALHGHIENMLIDPAYEITTDHNTAGASADLYRYANTIDWQGLCLKRVVDEYFRDQDEFSTDALIGSLPAAKIMQDNFMNSLLNASSFDALDVTVETSEETTANPDTGHAHTLSMKEMNDALQRYQWDRMNNLTEMTFDEYLRTHGVRTKTQEHHMPELLRYIREWTYPTNTVEPATGVATTACSWSIAERADKARFFTEPGFIFGVSVVRPKVYLGLQSGAAAGILTKATSWLPALLADDPYVAVQHFADATGPVPGLTDGTGYYLDVRDLFLHGDQFVNFDVDAAVGAGSIALPDASGEHKYPTENMADALFRYQGVGEDPTLELVHSDGVVSLNISGVQVDHSARTSVLT